MRKYYARDWAMAYFYKMHGIFVGIVISGIIFVIPHLTNHGINLLSVVNIFIVGIVFAVLFLDLTIFGFVAVFIQHGIFHRESYSDSI